MNLLKSEPIVVLIGGASVLIPVIFQMLAAFNVPVTPNQVQALTSLVTILVGMYARSKVSPTP